jgi:aspartyl-tRNA(Asn)/glutamyl-tRNA(Gln) amidotransferase subunit A
VPDYRTALTGDIKGLRIGVVRHLHKDDCAVTQEVSAALEEAFAVLRSLGATLGEVRLRPAQDYYDVKVTIAESELLAVHEQALRTRPSDFGEDFLGRVLPAVLISGRDYVQAQRERRRMLAEMAPVYADFDVLVTATAGAPAPRLGTWRTIEFWKRASLTTPFNVTGGRHWRSASGSAPAECRCRCRSSAAPSTMRRYCGWRMPMRRRRPGAREGLSSIQTPNSRLYCPRSPIRSPPNSMPPHGTGSPSAAAPPV